MLEWRDYISQLLSLESSFDGITLSFGESSEAVSVPPIIKASMLMLDKMLKNQGKFNIFVFPERIQSIFVFTLIRLIYNISEGLIDSSYDPDAFKIGENLRFGKAVVRFLGTEEQDGQKRMILQLADLERYSAPIDFFPLFQKTKAKVISRYKSFYDEKKSAESRLVYLTADQKHLQLLADHKTHMDSSIVNMTSIINTKELISECKLCGQSLKDTILVGQADYEGNVKNVGTGLLTGTPAIVLAADLYAIAAMAESGHPIQSIIIDGSNANALLSQMDALDRLTHLGVPITCVTDVVNSFDLNPFFERNFNLWRWDETSITEKLYDATPTVSDIKVKHCAKRTINYQYTDGKEISSAIELLNQHRTESQTASAKMIKVFNDLFFLTFAALWETVPLSETQRLRNITTLDECIVILEDERRFLPEETFEDYRTIVSSLRNVFSSTYACPKHDMLAACLSAKDAGKVVLVVPERFDKNRVQDYWKNWCAKHSLAAKIQVCYPVEYYLLPCDQFDSTIIVGWLKRVIMKKILFSFNTQTYTVLLYYSEKRWKNYSTLKWNDALDQMQNRITIERSFVTDTLPISTGRFTQPEREMEETPLEDEYDAIELILRENRYRQYVANGGKKSENATAEAIPINYVGGYLAFYRTGHHVVSASNIITHDADRIDSILPVDLKVGDFVIVREADRDLIKEIADVMLKRAGKSDMRELSGKWKEALEIGTMFHTPEEIYEQLQSVGCTRGYQAVRSWIMDEEMIAPQSKQDLEYIAAVTGSGVLEEMLDQVYDAAQIVKSAHVQAGRALSQQLKSRIVNALKEFGNIDPFNIWEPIEMQVDDVGLVRILKVIDIGSPLVVDIADTNRLIEV